MSISPDTSLFSSVAGKTVIVTGGAHGIGLEAIRQYHANGANVVIADLPSARKAAEDAIDDRGDASHALFVPVDIVAWDEVRALFAAAIERFGCVDIVVANAGIMESRGFFDFQVNAKGDLDDDGSGRVIDVNLKGTMNSASLRLSPKTPFLFVLMPK